MPTTHPITGQTFNSIFFCLDLIDKFGLTKSEMRVFVTVGSRGTCTASIRTLSNITLMDPRTIRACFKRMIAANVLHGMAVPGHPTHYRINDDVNTWTPLRKTRAAAVRAAKAFEANLNAAELGVTLPDHQGNPAGTLISAGTGSFQKKLENELVAEIGGLLEPSDFKKNKGMWVKLARNDGPKLARAVEELRTMLRERPQTVKQPGAALMDVFKRFK